MIFKSTNVTHSTTVGPDGEVLTYTIPLRSRFAGDRNPISSFRFRALSMSSVDTTTGDPVYHSLVQTSSGSLLSDSVTLTVGAKRRPPLMHYADGGISISGGIGGVSYGAPAAGQASSDLSQVGTLVMLIKPTTQFRVHLGTSILSIDPSGSGFTASDQGTGSKITGIYLNGQTWTGAQPFPFPRLVTVTYVAGVKPPIRFANPVSTGAPNQGQLSYFATSETALSFVNVSRHAAMFYRKPNGPGVLNDPEVVLYTPIDDAVVTNPSSWVTV